MLAGGTPRLARRSPPLMSDFLQDLPAGAIIDPTSLKRVGVKKVKIMRAHSARCSCNKFTGEEVTVNGAYGEVLEFISPEYVGFLTYGSSSRAVRRANDGLAGTVVKGIAGLASQ
jgi:hypothetical protein